MGTQSTRPGCLLAEPSEPLRSLYEYWLADARTKAAGDVESLRETMDPTIMVACVDYDILDGRRKDVLRDIFSENLYCQVLPIVPRNGNPDIVAQRYDGALQRPLNRRALRETLKRAFTRGQFLTLVHRYYVLNARVHSPSDDDVSDETTKQSLDKLQRRLQSIEKGLGDADRARIKRSFQFRKHLPNSVTDQKGSDQASKYRPTSCTECTPVDGDEDGVNQSFSKIAAGVWVCDECGAVVHVQTNANPWVAKR